MKASKTINKLLIANRGEIAVRIMNTARRMGIATLAIYSQPDASALHTRRCDEKVSLGNGELHETYLNIPKIIQIAQTYHCDAIHPGYGFLSENHKFAEACAEAGIIFVGPSAECIHVMGNKLGARSVAEKLNIPMTKAYKGNVQELLNTKIEIPYPLLIKAAAGGGGKGMKIVSNASQLQEMIESASREALSYFGDDTVFIEKYIENPRHIEVQILGDKHGNCIHLFERECSIQRRHQKIIEESPSVTLTEQVRSAMLHDAIRLAKEIGYDNAGTMEFLVDSQLNYYFLEMNTRIQVEHPVTEMVTRIDLVEEQIRIAQGEKLRYLQQDIQCLGHAIECRIYAENPANKFLPSPGAITCYHEPVKVKSVRIDSSIDGNAMIYSFFDPMISKLICFGENRTHACNLMQNALNEYVIQGIETNIEYLHGILCDENFLTNQISTHYCNSFSEKIHEFNASCKSKLDSKLPAIASILFDFYCEKKSDSIWQQVGFWRNTMILSLDVNGNCLQFVIQNKTNNGFECTCENTNFQVNFLSFESDQIIFSIDKNLYHVFVSKLAKGLKNVHFEGFNFTIKRTDLLHTDDFFEASEFSLLSNEHVISAPMFGKVLKINIEAGNQIKKGATLMIIEAMKMENNILAPKDLTVEAVLIKQNQMVETGAKLVEFS